MLFVYTGRIGRIKDNDALDITRGSGTSGLNGGLLFAPSSGLRSEAHAAQEAGHWNQFWPTFRDKYIREMRVSCRSDPKKWVDFLLKDRAVLLCYCENALRCHRYLLGAVILPDLGAKYEGEITDA